MQDWATRAISSGISDIGRTDIEALIQKEPVFFVYLHTFLMTHGELEDIEGAAKVLLGTPPIFRSQDPDVFKHLGVDPSLGSVIVAVKDHEARAASTLPLATPHPPQAISAWLLSEKLPTLGELSTHSFDDVMRNPSKPIVVLAALDGSSTQEQTVLLSVAKAWRDSGMKVLDRPVVFVWMDTTKWEKWLKSMYGVKTSNGPAIIITDHSALRYYDRDTAKDKIGFNQQSIFSTLDAINRGVVSGKHSENLAERAIRGLNDGLESVGRWATSKPYSAGGVIVLLLVGLIWVVRRVILMDAAPTGSYPNGYHKPGGRLD